MSTTPNHLMETVAATEEALDFASIKDAMDAFDPATLLPDLSKIFGTIPTLCRWALMIGPLVLLALGLAYLLFSPKEANHYFGYRCYYGMGSVQAWRFTQRFAGLVLGLSGLAMTVWMYLASSGFAAMDVTKMVWQTVNYLAVQAIVAFLANTTINLTALFVFNRRGEYRKAVRQRKNT